MRYAILTAAVSATHAGESYTLPAGTVCTIAEGPHSGGYVDIYLPWSVGQGVPASQGARVIVNPARWAPMMHNGAPIAVLNTSILPSGVDLAAVVVTIDPDIARRLAATGVRSHVGHESTAQIASAVLGVPVPMDRTPWAPIDAPLAIVIQLRGRPPEGRILTAEEIEAIGYDVRLLLTAPNGRGLHEYLLDAQGPIEPSKFAPDEQAERGYIRDREARVAWSRVPGGPRLAADVFNALI